MIIYNEMIFSKNKLYKQYFLLSKSIFKSKSILFCLISLMLEKDEISVISTSCIEKFMMQNAIIRKSKNFPFMFNI